MTMPAATAQQICLFALRKLGVVNRRQPVQVDDMQDALEALWFLIDSFNRQGLLIPFYKTVTFTADGSTRQFTIGSGGDFDTDPPLSIEAVQINSGGTVYNVNPQAGVEQWQNLTPYADYTNYPYFYIWNATYPAQTITFSGNLLDGDIISISGTFPFSATFSGSSQSTAVARTTPNDISLSLPAEVEFPAGYQSMMMWNLAEALLAEYPQENPVVVQQIQKEAAMSKAQLKNRNSGGRQLRFNDTNRPANRNWGTICAPYL